MQTVKRKHIKRGCIYCNNDHDPGITCRNVADCMQQEQREQPGKKKPKPQLVRDATGKIIAVKQV